MPAPSVTRRSAREVRERQALPIKKSEKGVIIFRQDLYKAYMRQTTAPTLTEPQIAQLIDRAYTTRTTILAVYARCCCRPRTYDRIATAARELALPAPPPRAVAEATSAPTSRVI